MKNTPVTIPNTRATALAWWRSTNKEYRKRENREWLQEMRDEEFGMGFQEG